MRGGRPVVKGLNTDIYGPSIITRFSSVKVMVRGFPTFRVTNSLLKNFERASRQEGATYHTTVYWNMWKLTCTTLDTIWMRKQVLGVRIPPDPKRQVLGRWVGMVTQNIVPTSSVITFRWYHSVLLVRVSILFIFAQKAMPTGKGWAPCAMILHFICYQKQKNKKMKAHIKIHLKRQASRGQRRVQQNVVNTSMLACTSNAIHYKYPWPRVRLISTSMASPTAVATVPTVHHQCREYSSSDPNFFHQAFAGGPVHCNISSSFDHLK